MMKQFLEAGEIVNVHGINGEVKIMPWCDSAEFLKKIKTLYIDNVPVNVTNARVHKACLLASLEGVSTVEQAMKLRGKIVFINRDDVKLPKNSHFVQDLLGLEVFDLRLNKVIGKLKDVMNMPASDVYVIEAEECSEEILIPVNSNFVKSVDVGNGKITVSTIEGMCDFLED